MKTPLSATLLLAILCSWSLTGFAHAAVVVSNLDTIRDGGLLVPKTPGASAMSFTTGAGSGWTLESIRVDLTSTPTGVGQIIDAFLYSDNVGLPGSPVGLIGSTTPLLQGNLIYTIDALSTINLNPFTTYWLVLSREAGADFNENVWGYTFSTDQTSAPGDWTIGDVGVVDYNDPIPQGWETTDPSRAFRFEINAVPEPSSALFGIMGSVLLIRRRR